MDNHVAYSTSVCLPGKNVVDAFEITRSVSCRTVVCVRYSPFASAEEGVCDVVVVVVVVTLKDLPDLHSPVEGHLMRMSSVVTG